MEWISILKCPITNQKLKLLEKENIQILNHKIASNKVWQIDGKIVAEPINSALSTMDGRYIYPILNGVIILLKDLALTDSHDNVQQETLSDEKKLVKDFYENKGWFANEKGDYLDAVKFEDLREVAKDYIQKCHSRVKSYLRPTGDYMLDAASGALQYQDYLQYSDGYKYRVCVDFSYQALLEAKRKLGEKGLCVLCDMTCLPFEDDVMGGFVSINTIYHIPENEQITAIQELYRVLSKESSGVVVYEWHKHSQWMNITLFPFRGFTFIRNRINRMISKLNNSQKQTSELYFHAHNYDYFRKNLDIPFEVKVWRTISVQFMKYYVHSFLFGKAFLKWLFNKENEKPEKFGLKGEYPILLFRK